MSESGYQPRPFGWASDLGRESLAIPVRGSDAKDKSLQSSQRLVEVMGGMASPGPIPVPGLDSLRRQVQQGKKLSTAFAALTPDEQKFFQDKIGEKPLQEIFSMSGEPDEQMFYHNLLHFGVRLKTDSNYEKAASVLGILSQGGAFKVPPEIQKKAEQEFNAIIGKGSVGMRLEVLADRFSEDATDPKTIVPMVGASLVGHLVGTSILGRLLAGSSEAWYSRGLGARLTAGFSGYAAESFAFALGNRAVTPHPEGPFSDDLWRSAIAIGALKGTAYLGNQVFLKLHGFNEFGVPARLTGLARFNQVAIPQFSMFTGMMASHLIETRMGLRPHTDDGTLVTDTLSSMLSLGVGMHAASRVLGPGFARFQTELALQAETYSRLADSLPHDKSLNPENTGPAFSFKKFFQELISPNAMMVTAGDGPEGFVMPMASISNDPHGGGGGERVSGVSTPKEELVKPEAIRVAKSIPSSKGKEFPFEVILSKEGNHLFTPEGSELVGSTFSIAERDGTPFQVTIDKHEMESVGDPITPKGTTKIRFTLKEGETRGKAFAYFDEKAVTLYFIDVEATGPMREPHPPMGPGAASLFMTWLAEETKRQGKAFNVTRITHPQTLRILLRQGLMDPARSTVEACERIRPEDYDEEYRVLDTFLLDKTGKWDDWKRSAEFFNIFGPLARPGKLLAGEWRVNSLLEIVPSNREINSEAKIPPILNPSGIAHTTDSLLDTFVAPNSRFVEIGFGKRTETLKAVEQRGARAWGLELYGNYPESLKGEDAEQEPIDLVFVSQQNPIYFKGPKVNFPIQHTLLKQVARSHRVMIQSYDPRSPLEILKHAETDHGVTYKILYYQGRSSGEAGPLFASDYGKDPGVYNTVLVAERVGSEAAPKLEVSNPEAPVPADPIPYLNPVPLDRKLHAEVSGLLNQVQQLPNSNPKKAEMAKRLEGIRDRGYFPGKEGDFYKETYQVEDSLADVWQISLEQRFDAMSGVILRLAEASKDEKLKVQFANFLEDAKKPEDDFHYVKSKFSKLTNLFFDAVSTYARRQWAESSSGEFPSGLVQSLVPVMGNLMHLELLNGPLSAPVLMEFIDEVVKFYRDYPPKSPLHPISLTPVDVALNRDLLISPELRAENYLQNITYNLQAYRRLFGKEAGLLFHQQARLISPLKGPSGQPSKYYLAIEKGQHEFANGLRLAIFEGDPQQSHGNAYLAKVGLNFKGDKLQLVNIQGPNKLFWGEGDGTPREFTRLEEFLGASPLDMLVASSVLIGRNADFEKIEGIRDGAQLSRKKLTRNKADNGFYDFFFRKFGFFPPEENGNYWALNLRDLEIYRKKARPGEAELSPEEYFSHVLARRTRDAAGKNIRPATWDKQASDPEAAVVFWQVLVPALSEAEYRPPFAVSDPLPKPRVPRPFEIKDLRPAISPEDLKFYRESLENLAPGDIADPYDQAFQSALKQGAEGRISSERAQVKMTNALAGDWIAGLEAYGPQKYEYPLEHLWMEVQQDKGVKLPDWIQSYRETRAGRMGQVTELFIDLKSYQRISDEAPEIKNELGFSLAFFGLLEDELGLPKGTLLVMLPGEQFRVRIPNSEFFFEALESTLAKKGMGARLTHELVQMKELRDLVEQNLRPVLFSRSHHDIHDDKSIHPFIVLLHDFYHILRLSRLPPEARRELVLFYDIFKELKPANKFEQKLLEQALETVLDGDPSGDPEHRPIFEGIREHEITSEFATELHRRMKEKLLGSERGEKVLRVFEASVMATHFFREAIEQDGPSALSPSASKVFQNILEDAAIGKLSVPQGVDPIRHAQARLLQILQVDLFAKLQEQGARLRRLTSKKLKTESPALEPWMGKQGVHELFIPKSLYRKMVRDQDSMSRTNFLLTLPRVLEAALLLPAGSLFFHDEMAGYRLRFIDPNLLLDAAPRLFGDRAIPIERVHDIVSHQTMREIMAADRRPLVLSPRAQNLHRLKAVHPYLAALHDIYHILKLSRLTPEARRSMVRIHDTLKELAVRPVEQDYINQALEGLMDGNYGQDGDFRSLFKYIKVQGPSQEFVEILHARFKELFTGDFHGEAILRAFEAELLGSKPPTDSGKGKQGLIPALAILPALAPQEKKELKATELQEVRGTDPIENASPAHSGLFGGSTGIELGMALILGMALFKRGKPKQLPPADGEKRALEKVPEPKVGLLAKFRPEFDANDDPYIAGTLPGIGMTLGEILGGFNFEHPVLFGVSVALSVFSGFSLLKRRNRMQRLFEKGEDSAFFRGDSVQGGPYREPGASKLNAEDYKKSRGLRLASLDESLNPQVRQGKLEELRPYLSAMNPEDPEFRRGMKDLLKLIRDPKVTRAFALMEEGTPVEPERTKITAAASIAVRLAALKVYQTQLESRRGDVQLRTELLRALRETIQKPQMPGQGKIGYGIFSVLSEVVSLRSSYYGPRLDTTIARRQAEAELEMAEDELRMSLFRIYRSEMDQVAPEHPELVEIYRLARRRELIDLAQRYPEFRQELLELPPLLAEDAEEMLKTREALRPLWEPPQEDSGVHPTLSIAPVDLEVSPPARLRVEKSHPESEVSQEEELEVELQAPEPAEKTEGSGGRGGGSGAAPLLAIGVGLGTFLDPKISWAAAGPLDFNLPSGDFLPEIGLGVAALSVAGVAAYRWWAARRERIAKEKIRDYWEPFLDQFKLPLNAQDKELLSPFYPKGQVPEVLTGKDWRRIREPLTRQFFTAEGEKVFPDSTEKYDLWVKIMRELNDLYTRSAGQEGPLAEDFDPNFPEFTWVTSFNRSSRKDPPQSYEEVQSQAEKRKKGGGVPPALGLMVGLGTADSATHLASISESSSQLPSSVQIAMLAGGLAMAGWFGTRRFMDWLKGLVKVRFDGVGFTREDPPPPDSPPAPENLGRPKPAPLRDIADEEASPPVTLAPGWIKKRKAEIDKILNHKGLSTEEKYAAVEPFIAQLVWPDFAPREAVEAAHALWNLATDPRLDEDSRERVFGEYSGFLQHEKTFPAGSPQLYREAMRLRRIFSQQSEDLTKRLKAAEAFGQLIARFDLSTEVGHGEAVQAALFLKGLFEEARPRVGRREIDPVLKAIQQLRLRGIL